MKNNLIKAIFIILLGLYARTAFATLDEGIATSLIDHGIKSSKKNDLLSAINDFSRALLLDVNNETAIDELLKISSSKSLPFDIKLLLLQFKDISAYITKLNNTISYYSKKTKSVEDKLLSSGISQKNIQSELNKLATFNEISVDRSRSMITQEDIVEKEPLAAVISYLTSIKNSLENENARLRLRYGSLMNIHKQVIIAKSNKALNKTVHTETPQSNNQAFSDHETGASVDSALYQNEEFLSNDAISVLSQQLYDLKLELQNKDLTIKNMASQIVDISLQLAENQNTFKNEPAESADLNFEITDLNSRLELGQKIIQEKDDQIKILQNDLSKIKQATIINENKFNETVTVKNKQLIEQNGILRIYKSIYWDTFKENKSNIANVKALEAQIEFAQKMIFEKERTINKFKQNVISFESKLFEAKSQISKMSMAYDDNVDNSKILIKHASALKDKIDSLEIDLQNQLSELDSIYSTFASDKTITSEFLFK